MVIEEKITKRDAFTLHIVPTKKFKTVTITLKFKSPVNREDATKRALIPFMLTHASEKYPTYHELRRYLDELYGVYLSVDLNKSGEYHICTFTMDIANDKFLKDSLPLLTSGFELLNELIFHPLVVNDGFDSSILEQEKQNLKDKLASLNDDKMKYAVNKLIEIMCKDELYSISTYGYTEDLEVITPQALYEYYKKMLTTDEVDLFVVGDVDEQEIERIVSSSLSFTPRQPELVETNDPKEVVEPKVEKEDQQLNQGKLNIGFRTYTKYGDEDYFALQIANGIFGGYPHSKLFINVREKQSLAYYAVSRLASHKGLMLVMSGIDPANFDKACTIIFEQLKEVQQGNFTEEDINQTKAVVKNQLLEGLDHPRGMVDDLYYNVVATNKIPISNWLEAIEQVKKEDVIKVSKKIQLDTTFFLN